MKIVSGLANEPLAEKIALHLGVQLSDREIFIFPDGERRVRVLGNFVEKSTVAVQPTAPPVDTNYMELFFLVDGLKRSGAEFVTAVVPYLGYQRQDHVFRDGEAVSLEVIVKTLESVGMDRIISIDLHTPKIPDVFTIPMTHLSALPLFAEKINVILEGISPIGSLQEDSIASLRQVPDGTWLRSLQNDMRAVLISPDMGGIRRIKMLSELLDGLPFAAIEKNRDLATGNVTADKIGEGSISGAKIAFIVDDMIASGKTIVTACEVLKSQGVEEIYVFATHPIFAKEAPELLESSLAKRIFVTDTVKITEDKLFPKLEVLSVAGIIAEAIKNA
jgi:ribose-phosphate pyrophosphokinase